MSPRAWETARSEKEVPGRDRRFRATQALTVLELTRNPGRLWRRAFRRCGSQGRFPFPTSIERPCVLRAEGCPEPVELCVVSRAGVPGFGPLRDGVHVVLGGEITVYEPRGQYQLRVATVELEGVGAFAGGV